jgi:hypothetical protein
VDEADYVERAKRRILDVLDDQHAVVPLELEARLAEAGFAGSGLNIDPHHVTAAVRDLVSEGEVLRAGGSTRGGRDIDTIQPADQRRRGTVIAKAAARKRLLYARYLGWAGTTARYEHGQIGPAGEQAVRGGILAAGSLQPAQYDAGPVSQLLGVDLPGPLDSAGYVVPLTAGIPGQPVTVAIEVKNIRGWIYPTNRELYQLLHKAAVLQQARPTQPILAVLVCRRAHTTSYWMAKQFGFLVVDMESQYAGSVEEAALDEVRNELHFQDLRVGTGPSLRVRDRFRDTVPEYATAFAARWQKTTANTAITDLIEKLRYATRFPERAALMTELRDQARRAGYGSF